MKTIDKIHSILSEQVIGYRSLMETLRRERECLVNFNPDAVETLSKEKDTIVLKLRLLEEERIRLVRAFAAEQAIPEDSAMQKLTELSGDDRFQRLRLQLISLLQSIMELNDFNRVLIERSANVVRNALNFLGSFGIGAPVANKGSLLSREV